MKLRIAKKILATRDPDGGCSHRYRDDQIGRALRRVEKTASSKESTRYFYRLMDVLGPEGRAYIIRKCEEAEGLSFGRPVE